MASKKKVGALPRRYAALDVSQRDAEFTYLKRALTTARKFVKGFEARDGYSMRRSDLLRLPHAKYTRLLKVAKFFHKATASPYLVATPRTKKQRDSAIRKSGQNFKGQKNYVVHVPVERPGSRIRFVDGNLEIRDKLKGGEVFRRWFYLPKAKTMEQVIANVKAIYRFLPNGSYVLESSSQGSIGVAILKRQLIDELRRRWLIYDRLPGDQGLAGEIVALRYIGDTFMDRAGEYQERLSRRQAFRDARADAAREEKKRALARRGKITKRGRLTGRR